MTYTAFIQAVFMTIFFNFNQGIAHQLVDLKTVIPTLIFDIRYATENNFVGKQIYFSDFCYCVDLVADALVQIQKELEQYGLGLKIWDAYRPMSAQWKFWSLMPDERYVSDPRKGGRHTRGTAVDVTIIDLKTKIELEMPTEFDDFTSRAWSDCDDVSEIAKENRALLRSVMEKYGFEQLPTEWWHFDFKGWQKFPVLDVEFDTENE